MSATQQFSMALVAAAAAALSTVGGLLALGWFGMWMGLTSRTANLADLENDTFCSNHSLVCHRVWFHHGDGSFYGEICFGLSSSQPTWWLIWWPLLSAVLISALALTKDIAFIVWSRKRLYTSFRERAARGVGQTGFVAPPPSPLTIPSPPVIAAQP